MPRNSQGIYSLPSGNPVVPGTLIESTWANPTMSDIAAALTGSLPRDGSAAMTGPLVLARDGQLPKEAVTLQQFTAQISGNNSYLPAGAIQAFAMAAIPTGWLECNGAAVSRTTYANLFATIGTTYGTGNGTTTFNLPDLRGEFIRGWDNGRSVDPNRVMGSNQTGANSPHTHTVTDPGHTHGATQAAHTHNVTDPGHSHGVGRSPSSSDYYGPYSSFASPSNSVLSTNNTTGISIQNAQPVVTVSSANAGVTIGQEGTESRPRNVAMVYCIKAFGALQTDGLGSMAFQNKESVQITNGTGVFSTLQVTTAPVNPTDVMRLQDIPGGGVTSVTCDDTQLLLVDNTDPTQPILRPQANVPHGMVKLDANGKVPNALMDPTGYNYQGTWDASGGTLPGGAQLDGSMYYIDVPGTLTLYHSDGQPKATICSVGTRIVYVTESPTLPVPNWYYEPPPALSGATASQVSFAPYGGISATNVQTAIEQVEDGKRVITANDANPGMRITQTGTGDALVVEDATSPDGTPFVIDANGNVLIGATAKPSWVSVGFSIYGDGTFKSLTSVRCQNDANSPSYVLTKARGSVASPLVIQADDYFGNLNFSGFDGASSIVGAQISGVVDGTPGPNDMPGRLVFSTTPDGAAGPTERMRIDSGGSVSVGTAPVSGQSLRVNKSITGSTTSVGVLSDGAVQSDVTSQGRYFQSFAQTQATTFTTSILHYLAEQGVFGAGSTVTNQYGFLASSALIGATNNYGFSSNIPAGAGRYNFYAAGTADNYFAGNVGIGNLAEANVVLSVRGAQRNHRHSANDASPIYHSNVKARGTSGAPLTVNNGDSIAAYQAYAYDGSGERQSAVIVMQVDGVPATSTVPGRIVFSTAPAGTSQFPLERMRIDSSGNVIVATRAINAPLADNDGSFDMAVKNNFTCTPAGAVQLDFTNVTAGQSGLIYFDNTAGGAVTKAAKVLMPADTLAELSVAGKYLLTYYAPNATTVVIVSSGALA